MVFMAALPTVSTSTAHILRRLTLAPSASTLGAFDGRSADEVVRTLLAAAPLDVAPPTIDADGDFFATTDWWLSVMRDPQGGLHERMTWFWHGHLTSGLDKASPAMMLDQLLLLRRHALGNFRTMLREITLDPAMLSWLDGSGSDAAAPNENYARELMELFALGHDSGAYTEADVINGARALAGYWIDNDDQAGDGAGSVQFEPEGAIRRPVPFLGTNVRDVDDVIDAVCDHPACSRYIARTLYIDLVGSEPTGDRLEELATVFRDADLEIAPLVEAIATGPDFLDAAPRPRSALEWFLAFERLFDTELEIWTLESMGQMPLNPPNVAGWPGTERWVSSGMLMIKAQTALDMSWDTATLDPVDPIGDVLQRAALAEISPETRAALDDIVASATDRQERSSLLYAAVALSPEFSLA